MDSLSYEELLTLNRALMERHFIEEVHSSALIGSPILAEIHNRVVDCIIAIEVERKGDRARAQWENWRNLNESKGITWKVFMHRLEDPAIQKYLRSVDTAAQREYVRTIASPFVLSDEQLNTLLKLPSQ